MYLDGITVDVNKLADQLKQIAGPIAKQGWDIYLRQQYVIGWQEIAMATISLIVLVICAISFVWAVRSATARDDAYNEAVKDWQKPSYSKPDAPDATGEVATMIAAGVFGLVAFFGLLMWSMDGFAHLFNPGYGAIQGILGR